MPMLPSLLNILTLSTTLVTAYAPLPNCHPFNLDIPIQATSLDLNIALVDNNIDAVSFAVDLDRWDAPNITSRIISIESVEETFTIYAELCTPDNGTVAKKEAIQILTHGAVFDHRYWDVDLNRTAYSHDGPRRSRRRLYSPKLRPALQRPLGQSRRVYTRSRPQRTPDPPCADGDGTSRHIERASSSVSTLPPTAAFDKVIHIGHFFRSQLTAALLTAYGNSSDATILTALVFASHNLASATIGSGFEVASLNNPALYRGYPPGYLVPSDASKIETGFFHRTNSTDPAGFTDDALAYAESVKPPLAIGEWHSLRGLLEIGPNPSFTGPVQVFAAEFDELVCRGDWKDNDDSEMLEGVYPNARARGLYVQPAAGHGLVLHRNATGGFAVMMEFLGGFGL